MTKVALFTFVIILLGCSGTPILSDTEISSWQNDSIACNDVRAEVYQKILVKKDLFKNKNTQGIVNILGNPNIKLEEKDGIRFYYFVEGGPQCSYVDKNGYDTLSVEVLFVFFDKAGSVVKVGGMKP